MSLRLEALGLHIDASISTGIYSFYLCIGYKGHYLMITQCRKAKR